MIGWFALFWMVGAMLTCFFVNLAEHLGAKATPTSVWFYMPILWPTLLPFVASWVVAWRLKK